MQIILLTILYYSENSFLLLLYLEFNISTEVNILNGYLVNTIYI